MTNIKQFIPIITLSLGLISCTTEKGAAIVDHKDKFFSRDGASKYVVAKSGDTIDSIARKYNISQAEIMRLNHTSSNDVKPGARILLPANARGENISVAEQKNSGYRPGSNGKDGGMGYFYTKKTTITQKTFSDGEVADDRHPSSSWEQDSEIAEKKLSDLEHGTKEINTPKETASVEATGTAAETEPREIAVSAKDYKTTSPLNLSNFEWPLHGKILSRYGNNGRKFNDGINVAASEGTPVIAASDGKVAYIGNNVAGYGNLVILKHSNNIMTAYAHLDEIIVERGAQVKKGESIGNVGKSGNVSQPQLHFSVRKGKKTVDPEKNVN